MHPLSTCLLAVVVVASSPAHAADAVTPSGLATDPAAAATPPGFDLAAFNARIRPSIVQLVARDSLGNKISSGSGFFVTADGLVATNHHVIDDAEQMTAELASGEEVPVSGIVAIDESVDLAVVKIEGGGRPALELEQFANIREGNPAIVISNPLGLTFTLSEGIVSAVRPNGLPDADERGRVVKGGVVQYTTPTTFGSSGAPVLSREGKVIAIVQSVAAMADIGFGVSPDELRRLLASVGPDPKVRPFREFPLRNLLISAAFFVAIGAYFVVNRRR